MASVRKSLLLQLQRHKVSFRQILHSWLSAYSNVTHACLCLYIWVLAICWMYDWWTSEACVVSTYDIKLNSQCKGEYGASSADSLSSTKQVLTCSCTGKKQRFTRLFRSNFAVTSAIAVWTEHWSTVCIVPSATSKVPFPWNVLQSLLADLILFRDQFWSNLQKCTEREVIIYHEVMHNVVLTCYTAKKTGIRG